jgi:hypothetical protein
MIHKINTQNYPTPFNVGDKTCATNGYVLIAIPKEGDYEDKSEKVKGVYPVDPATYNCKKEYSLNQLKEALKAITMVDEIDYDECNECNGEGVVEWEYSRYTMDLECPVCNGAGCFEKKTGEKTFDGNDNIEINGYYFTGFRLKEIIDVCDWQQVNKVTLLRSSIKGSLFHIGNCEMIVMPLNSPLNIVYTL